VKENGRKKTKSGYNMNKRRRRIRRRNYGREPRKHGLRREGR
jgi:hypothetical protein